MAQKNFDECPEFNRSGLTPTPKLQSLAQAIAEGDALLANEKKTNSKIISSTPVAKAPVAKALANPYAQARINVLSGMTDFAKNEILTMEKNKDLSNRWYEDFVQRVAKEGDRLSP